MGLEFLIIFSLFIIIIFLSNINGKKQTQIFDLKTIRTDN